PSRSLSRYLRMSALISAALILPPPSSPLFPYTPLFRSSPHTGHGSSPGHVLAAYSRLWRRCTVQSASTSQAPRRTARSSGATTRSEEHTSELQSHLNLVCRLLLEKKNKYVTPATIIIDT